MQSVLTTTTENCDVQWNCLSKGRNLFENTACVRKSLILYRFRNAIGFRRCRSLSGRRMNLHMDKHKWPSQSSSQDGHQRDLRTAALIVTHLQCPSPAPARSSDGWAAAARPPGSRPAGAATMTPTRTLTNRPPGCRRWRCGRGRLRSDAAATDGGADDGADDDGYGGVRADVRCTLSRRSRRRWVPHSPDAVMFGRRPDSWCDCVFVRRCCCVSEPRHRFTRMHAHQHPCTYELLLFVMHVHTIERLH